MPAPLAATPPSSLVCPAKQCEIALLAKYPVIDWSYAYTLCGLTVIRNPLWGGLRGFPRTHVIEISYSIMSSVGCGSTVQDASNNSI